MLPVIYAIYVGVFCLFYYYLGAGLYFWHPKFVDLILFKAYISMFSLLLSYGLVDHVFMDDEFLLSIVVDMYILNFGS